MSGDELADRNLENLLASALAQSGSSSGLAEAAQVAIARGYAVRRRRAWTRVLIAGTAAGLLALLVGRLISTSESLPPGPVHLGPGATAKFAPGVRGQAFGESDLILSRDGNRLELRMAVGDVLFNVDPGSADVTVATPCGAVHVTGTQFEVRSETMTRGEGVRLAVVSVAVFSGTIAFLRSGSDAAAPVHAGAMLVASGDGAVEQLTLGQAGARMRRLSELEKENIALSRQLTSLQAEHQSLLSRPATSAPPPAEGASKVPAPSGLDAINWDGAAAAFLKAAKAMREGGATKAPDPEALGQIGKLLGSLGALRTDLGGATPNEWLANPRVQSRLVAAMARALRPDLTDDARGALAREVREATEAGARGRPVGVSPLGRIRYDMKTNAQVREILTRYVGTDAEKATDGLALGASGDLKFGRTYVPASDRASMVTAILSYWREAVRFDDGPASTGRQTAGRWADSFVALRDRAANEFGAETMRAALTKPPGGDVADPLAATRSDPAFSAKHKAIIDWVLEMQSEYETEFFRGLSDAQRTAYGDTDPELLLFSPGE